MLGGRSVKRIFFAMESHALSWNVLSILWSPLWHELLVHKEIVCVIMFLVFLLF